MENTNNTFNSDFLNQSIQPQTIFSQKKSNLFKYLFIICLLALIVSIICFIFLLTKTNSKLSPVKLEKENPKITQTIEKNKSVLIYAETINEIDDNGRIWPIYKIYRVVNNGQPEVLIPSIGGVGEYPSNFVLSPDKKSLIIILGKRLASINLETKELTDILNYEHDSDIGNIAFSPNSQEIFVWDRKSNGFFNKYPLYTYNLIKKEKKVFKKEIPITSELNLSATTWRKDNKIILEEPRGGAPSILWIYDLNTNELVEKEEAGIFSDDGTIMVTLNSSVDDPCNLYSGTDLNGYKITDPIIQIVKDEIKIDNKVIELLAISPNNDEVMYSTKNLINPNLVDKDFSNCEQLYADQSKTEQFYLKKIDSESKLISEYVSTLKKWNINLEAKYEYDSNKIQNGSQIITPSSQFYQDSLRIIAQFYQ